MYIYLIENAKHALTPILCANSNILQLWKTINISGVKKAKKNQKKNPLHLFNWGYYPMRLTISGFSHIILLYERELLTFHHNFCSSTLRSSSSMNNLLDQPQSRSHSGAQPPPPPPPPPSSNKQSEMQPITPTFDNSENKVCLSVNMSVIDQFRAYQSIITFSLSKIINLFFEHGLQMSIFHYPFYLIIAHF